MRIVKAEGASPILLWRQGEVDATRVEFDLSRYVRTFGEGEPQLTVKRPGDSVEYAAALEREGGVAVWVVGPEWLTVEGQGRCQLSWHTADGRVAKSEIYKTQVQGAMGVSNETAPEPQAGYLAQVQEAGAKAVVAADQAKAAAVEVNATAKRFDEVVEQTVQSVEMAAEKTENAAGEVEEAAQKVKGYSENPPIIGENGNWWVWDGERYVDSGVVPSEGLSGADGGYYAPTVTQLTADTVQISFRPSASDMPAVPAVVVTLPAGPTGADGRDGQQGERGPSGVYLGSGEMPADCNVQIDPDGDALTEEELVDAVLAALPAAEGVAY